MQLNRRVKQEGSISDLVDLLRLDASRRLDGEKKIVLDQYFSSAALARLMASMFSFDAIHVRILDPGAGVGSLFAACVDEVMKKDVRPQSIHVTAFEIDHTLAGYLNETFKICSEVCTKQNIDFEAELVEGDFIRDSADRLGLSYHTLKRFNYAILNPPYGKINVASNDYKILKSLGSETTNYYAAFTILCERLLEEGGQLVSITPRSFCNGPYFKSFRKLLFETMSLKRIHLFNSRTSSFKRDDVLQENIILHTGKEREKSKIVTISSSDNPADEYISLREVSFESVISPSDPEAFIRIIPDEIGSQISERMSIFRCKLEDLGLDVSTGKIVDFRATEFMRESSSDDTAPLIHPLNMTWGFVKWPLPSKKHGNIVVNEETENLLVPKGNYVLVRRFTANEERRRIVASIYDESSLDHPLVGFENRINYFHRDGVGLDIELAKGLAVFLNSTLVDSFFRQFNGHTQVNATDLRNLFYPTLDELRSLGSHVPNIFPEHRKIDRIFQTELFKSLKKSKNDPIAAKQKVEDALYVLKELDLPREQQNERSGLTLLALLNLKPLEPWSKAKSPLCGITPIMKFFGDHYGKKYAPNTRETVRRFTVHQFLQAGLIIENPDKPDRPINSPKAVYQIEEGALEMLRTFGTHGWQKSLGTYRSSAKSLRERYAMEREMQRVPVVFNDGQKVHLSAGGQNILVKKII